MVRADDRIKHLGIVSRDGLILHGCIMYVWIIAKPALRCRLLTSWRRPRCTCRTSPNPNPGRSHGHAVASCPALTPPCPACKTPLLAPTSYNFFESCIPQHSILQEPAHSAKLDITLLAEAIMVHLARVSNDAEVKQDNTLVEGLEKVKFEAADDEDSFSTTVYGSRWAGQDLPRHEMPEREMPKEVYVAAAAAP
jgi:hypothetical protein